MELYEVFKSEGGYRFCGAVWSCCPIIQQSPWFPTRREAEKAARRNKAEKELQSLVDACSTCSCIGELRGAFKRLEDFCKSHSRIIPSHKRFSALDEVQGIFNWFEEN